MLECLILGDEFAIDAQKIISKCDVVAESKIDSNTFNKKYEFSFYADTVIISLGSNDNKTNSFDDLFEIRQRVGAKNVFWILPSNEKVKSIVQEVAEYYGDRVVD